MLAPTDRSWETIVLMSPSVIDAPLPWTSSWIDAPCSHSRSPLRYRIPRLTLIVRIPTCSEFTCSTRSPAAVLTWTRYSAGLVGDHSSGRSGSDIRKLTGRDAPAVSGRPSP